jgi:hypothetical protein
MYIKINVYLEVVTLIKVLMMNLKSGGVVVCNNSKVISDEINSITMKPMTIMTIILFSTALCAMHI